MTEAVRVHGLDIAFDRRGSGPLLVLVHGAGDDARFWRPQVTALAEDFTVVAWDEPGAGRSADLPPGFELADYADCLAGLIEAVGSGTAHVVGLSWGGTVVLELYRRRPELVATLVLADTYAGWKGSLPEDEVRARGDAVRQMLAAPPEDLEPMFPGLFAGEPSAAAAALLAEIAADLRPATLRRQLDLMPQADQRDVLPAIAVPTLLLWGHDDVRSPLRVADEFAQAIPTAELVVIPGAGHVSSLERPEEFNDALRAFCLAHPPAV